MQSDSREELLCPVGVGSCAENLPEERLRGPKKEQCFVGVEAPVKKSRPSSGQTPDPAGPWRL